MRLGSGAKASGPRAGSRSDAEWRRELTPAEYDVLRRGGTEAPFQGRYWDCHEDGTYQCAGCGVELFGSQAKFDSRSGWPSFTEPAAPGAVETRGDWSWWGRRTEVLCSNCGGHLGHVFPDGPRDRGGRRFCINSASLSLGAGDPPARG